MRTGRPRAASDQAIFDAVSTVVTEAGPTGLTLAAVAERVGVSAPALTQRFGSKRNLLLAYAESAATSVDALVAEARAASGAPLGAVRTVLLAFASGLRTRAGVANNLAFLHLDLTDPELGALAAKQSRLMRKALAQLLEEAVAAGELVHPAPDELADTLYTVYNGALVTWAIDGKDTLRRWLSVRIDRILEQHGA